MNTVLKKLRNRSDTQKKQIAFGISSLVFLVIASIWILTFSVRFPGLEINDTYISNNDTADTSSIDNTAAVSASSPLDSVRAQLNSQNGVTVTDVGTTTGDTGNQNQPYTDTSSGD